MSPSTGTGVRITADPKLPVITAPGTATRRRRSSSARTSTRTLYARWVGPAHMTTEIDHWDARSGDSWTFSNLRGGERHSFRGCFHEVRPDRLVQTFTYLGDPDGVALETLTFEDLGDGRSRLHTRMLETASRASTPGSPAAWRAA